MYYTICERISSRKSLKLYRLDPTGSFNKMQEKMRKYWRRLIKVLVFFQCCGAEIMFGFGSTFVHNFGSGSDSGASSSSCHILPLKMYYSITVCSTIRNRLKGGFSSSNVLQTDCSKYLLKR